MNRRIIAAILMLALLTAMLAFPAAAQEEVSTYFEYYNATLAPGSNQGRIVLSYSYKTSMGGITKCGISMIKVYYASGAHYTTISGSTSNGLLRTTGGVISGSYTISCNAGDTFYCVVTFIEQSSASTIYEYVTTNTARAPSESSAK